MSSTSTSTVLSPPLDLLEDDWVNKSKLLEVSRVAAVALLQQEQTLAKQFLSKVGEGEGTVVSSVTGSDGNEMTVAVLKPSRTSDAFKLRTGRSGNVSVPQAVLQQLGSGVVALTAGPLSSEMTRLLSAAGAGASQKETDLAAVPLSLSLFDSSGNPLKQALQEPIVLSLNGDDRHAVCVFWDPEKLKWSREGVSRVLDGSSSISCQTTHLSIFAAMRFAELDFNEAFDCASETFVFSSESLGKNPSWWRQGAASALWAVLVLCLIASLVAVSRDARSDLSKWSRELLSEPPLQDDLETARGDKSQRESLQKQSHSEPLLERVMIYCFRCLQAFHVGVDVDTLGLSLVLAQDPTDRDPTPLRRAALDLAEEKDLFASATSAICSFTGAKSLLARFLLLFPALHPGTGLLASSLFYPRLSVVILFSCKLMGPMVLNVFVLQSLGVVFMYSPENGCEVQEALLKPLCAAMISCLLGQCVVIFLRRLQLYNWSKEGESTVDEWHRVQQWRRRVHIYWTASLLYLALSIVCIAAFLSSVSPGDGTYWLYGALVNAVFQLLLVPFLNAFSLALLSMVARISKPRKSAEAEGKGKKGSDSQLDQGVRPKAADLTRWEKSDSSQPGTPRRFLSGCVLEDYFAVTESAPDSSRLGSLDLSPLRGHDKDGIAFNETGFSFKPETVDCEKVPEERVVRPDTPRCFEATVQMGHASHADKKPTGGLVLSGRPSSPFQPMAAGLEGCKWREDGDGLEFDLSQDLPGSLLNEVFDRVRPTCAMPSNKGLDSDSEALSDLVLDMFDVERPPARQSSDFRAEEGLGTLRLHFGSESLGRTMTWSRKVEPNLSSIHESQDDWPQKPFHFSDEVFDEGDMDISDLHCASPVKALTPESQAGDGAFDAFPARLRTAIAGMDSDGGAWAWVRPSHVPDPYGTWCSSESSASSAAFEESPFSASACTRQDVCRRPAESSGSRGGVFCVDIASPSDEDTPEEVFDSAEASDLRHASQADGMQAWTAVSWTPSMQEAVPQWSRPPDRQRKVPLLGEERPWRNWLSRAAADT
eukprot:s3511_g3.t1